MKKLVSLLLVVAMLFTFTACGDGDSDKDNDGTAAAGDITAVAKDDIKVGFIFVGDQNEGYTAAHYNAAQDMMKALDLEDDQVVYKMCIPEDEKCYDAAVDLAEQGCNIIFANSFGHEDYMIRAAKEYPNIQFCHATGFKAKGSELSNMHNYFTSVYEARYLSGVVAGMKLQEMIKNGEITKDQAKVGYVGAKQYAEVISGYTAFFLGVRSVCADATMEVVYTGSWADFSLEKEAAETLINDKCVLISQHADTTGAPTACEAKGVYCVGYNVDMTATAPKTALTSASINWEPYYEYAVKSVIDGKAIDVDWCKGVSEGACGLTDLNTSIIAAGTEDAVKTAKQNIIDGKLHVFDTSTWTEGGKTLTSWKDDNGNEYIKDGYFHESELSSAPSFALTIDGITCK